MGVEVCRYLLECPQDRVVVHVPADRRVDPTETPDVEVLNPQAKVTVVPLTQGVPVDMKPHCVRDRIAGERELAGDRHPLEAGGPRVPDQAGTEERADDLERVAHLSESRTWWRARASNAWASGAAAIEAPAITSNSG
ncbi:MAG: hypothetical protein JO329_10205 [Planctomycetaceae bacterium]|nr:hypothetical protein [Planctomycetaceae bacterium]